jgi:hypothetical protein
MKSDNPAKHFILAFLAALLGYAIFYYSIEHRRTRKGPWLVTFTNDPAGSPAIVINQPALSITNVHIVFAGVDPATNTPRASAVDQLRPHSAIQPPDFSQPRKVPYDVPFGQCIFMDTTFLPGTVTLLLFGHEIELLPRVLILEHQEQPWRSHASFTLAAKPP